MTERESLRGNVLFHPSTKTPHDYPSFLRSAVCRVVAGSMLLSGTVSGLAALTTMHETKLACALSTAVSFVAFYHYGKLVQLRENKDATVALATPGKATDEALPLGLKLAWIDMQADAVRYSDWLVTLPLLVVEMHLLVPAPKLFGIPQALVHTRALEPTSSYRSARINGARCSMALRAFRARSPFWARACASSSCSGTCLAT